MQRRLRHCSTGDLGAVASPNWGRETILLEPLHEPKLVPDEDDPSRPRSSRPSSPRHASQSADGQRSVVREGCGPARGFALRAPLIGGCRYWIPASRRRSHASRSAARGGRNPAQQRQGRRRQRSVSQMTKGGHTACSRTAGFKSAYTQLAARLLHCASRSLCAGSRPERSQHTPGVYVTGPLDLIV
jgi:hypothetical protein